jgi:hypothetical protein
MKADEVLEKATRLVESGRPEQVRDALATLADFLVHSVARGSPRGQASILRVTRPREEFVFAYPPELSSGNRVPVLENSIAGRVILSARSVIENNVPEKTHFGFYERVPNPRGEVRTIQKMVAAPVVAGDSQTIGVVEVSLTGLNRAQAGADFDEDDAFRLETYCEVFAPLLQRIWGG